MVIKYIPKPLFCFIRSSTKTTEFENVKFRKSISFKEVFAEISLRLTVAVCFQKSEWFKNVNFLILFFQLIIYNSVVFTMQICFSPTLLESWVHISDNIADVGFMGKGKENEIFLLFNNYLDDIFTLKDLLGLVKS